MTREPLLIRSTGAIIATVRPPTTGHDPREHILPPATAAIHPRTRWPPTLASMPNQLATIHLADATMHIRPWYSYLRAPMQLQCARSTIRGGRERAGSWTGTPRHCDCSRAVRGEHGKRSTQWLKPCSTRRMFDKEDARRRECSTRRMFDEAEDCSEGGMVVGECSEETWGIGCTQVRIGLEQMARLTEKVASRTMLQSMFVRRDGA